MCVCVSLCVTVYYDNVSSIERCISSPYACAQLQCINDDVISMSTLHAEMECCRLLPGRSSLSSFTGFLTSKVSPLIKMKKTTRINPLKQSGTDYYIELQLPESHEDQPARMRAAR